MSSRGIAIGLKKGFQITKVDKRRKVAATKGVRQFKLLPINSKFHSYLYFV